LAAEQPEESRTADVGSTKESLLGSEPSAGVVTEVPTDADIPESVVESTEKEISSESTEKEVSAESTEKELPSESTEKELPSESTEKELPSESTEKELPSESTEEELPSESTEKEVSSESIEKEESVSGEKASKELGGTVAGDVEARESEEKKEQGGEEAGKEVVETDASKVPEERAEAQEESRAVEPIDEGAPHAVEHPTKRPAEDEPEDVVAKKPRVSPVKIPLSEAFNEVEFEDLKNAAFQNRLIFDKMSKDETEAFWDVVEGGEEAVAEYLTLRNNVLRMWGDNPVQQLLLESVKDFLDSRNVIYSAETLSRAYVFLDRWGYINYGMIQVLSKGTQAHGKKVVVIGAGIAGLAAAQQLKRFGKYLLNRRNQRANFKQLHSSVQSENVAFFIIRSRRLWSPLHGLGWIGAISQVTLI
jgi:hypothetical protein